jgi:hypothetical protein
MMHYIVDRNRKGLPLIDNVRKHPKDAGDTPRMPGTESTKATRAASRNVPRDPEGTFTRGTPEARTCLQQVAVEVGVPMGRPERKEEAGETREWLALGAAADWETPGGLLQKD